MTVTIDCRQDGIPADRSVSTDTVLYDLPEHIYHADRLPVGPSLSSTMAKTLLRAGGPARLRHLLDTPPARSRAYDFGTAAHARILGRGQETTVIDGDRRTKAVREQIADAEASGLIVLRPEEQQAITDMAEALLRHPVAGELLTAGAGRPEVSMLARDARTGRWTRGRIDFLAGRQLIVDYKTGVDASPHAFERAAWRYGYHVQAAHYLRLARQLQLVEDEAAYLLIVQEKSAPYLPAVYQLDEPLLEHGLAEVERAITAWDEALALGEWPGIAPGPHLLRLPDWATTTTDLHDEEIVL